MGERHIDPKLAAARMSVRKAGGVGLAGLAGWGDNASSGIGATPGLKKALSLAATSMGCVKMVIEGEQVVGSKVRVNPGDPWGHKLDSLSTYLNETDPVYFALFRGEKQCLLITYVPDNAKPGNKMRYASSKNSVKDAILEIDFGCQLEEFNVTTAHELSYSEYKKRENTPKPFSEAELLRQQQDSSETAGGYGVLARILAQERQRDLISGDANAKPFALPGLTSLSAGITPSALKNKNKGAASSPTSSSTSVPDVHRESPEVLVQQQQQHNIAAEVLSKLKPAPAAVSPVNPIPVVTHVVATVPTHAPVEVSVPPARNLETKTAVHIKETINPDDDEDKDSDVEELALLKEEIVDDGDNVEAMDITALRKKLDDIDQEKKVEKVIEFEDDVDDIKGKPEKVMKSSADEEEDDEEDAKEMKMLMEPEPGVSIPVDEEMLVNVLGRKNVEEEPEKVEVVKAEEKVTTSALFARPKTSDLDDFPQEDDEDEVASVKSSQQKKQNRPVSSKASAQLEERPASGSTKSVAHLGHISKASSFSKLSKGKGKMKALVKRIADTTETYMRRFSKARVQEVAVPDSKLQSLDDTNGTVTLDDIKSMKDMNDFGAYEKNTIEFNLSEREFMEVFNMDKQAYNKLGKGKKQKLKKKVGIL